MIAETALAVSCDVYRPFGAGSAATTGVAGRLTADFARGMRPTGSGLIWSHMLDLPPGIDLRDGCSRSAGSNAVTYADGDEVRIPSGGSTRYVVVWVEVRQRGTPAESQRAYLLRDTASWPTP